MKIDEQLHSITDTALRRGVLFFVLLALPTAVASVWRGIQDEWQPLFTLQLALLATLLVVSAVAKRLPRSYLGVVLIALSAITALGGLFTYGSIAPAGHWFLATALFYLGMVFGSRGMWVGALLLLAGVLLVAWLHVGGFASAIVPASSFALAPVNWVIELMCAALFMAIVLPTSRAFVEACEQWIQEREERRREIGSLAMQDEPTGLPLLRTARDRLVMSCRRSRGTGRLVAVMSLHLHGINELNERHGDRAGDSVLRAIADRLSGRLRDGDTMARSGGEEFVLILEDLASDEEAGRMATRVIDLVNEPVDAGGRPVTIAASVGVALSPDHGKEAVTLLRSADQAMYRARLSGRNGYALAERTDTLADTADGHGAGVVDGPAGDSEPGPAFVDESGMMQQLSTTVIDRCIMVLAATITLTVAANVWRIVYSDVAPNVEAALTAMVLSLALLIGRKRIPLGVKVGLVSGLGLVIGLPGLFRVGLAGPVVGWALAAAVFLFGAFYSWRICLAAVAVVLGAIVLAGAGYATGTLVYGFDVDQQALHPSKWLVFIMAAVAYAGVVLAAWSSYKATAHKLLEDSVAETAELVKLSTIDELTGLPQLRLAVDRLDMACKRARRAGSRVGLLLINLDGFKAINDTYGRDAGDYCLREIARRIAEEVGASDTAARIGGDEFLVILEPVADAGHAAATAERLMASIARPMRYVDHPFAVSAAVAIAMFPEHGKDIDSLREAAYKALYAAKRQGKNSLLSVDALPAA
ncbi:MAG: GGDEF domain-containing protein [Halioglobus sp.]|nr:GGDEF domain-containing protein [Halioglobus sp.]